MTRCCNVHDWDYTYDAITKKRANKWFLVNLNRRIKANTKWKWLIALRQLRAKTYFLAVEKFGY